MSHTIIRGVSAAPPRSIGYWALMVGGIIALVMFYASVLLFGQAW